MGSALGMITPRGFGTVGEGQNTKPLDQMDPGP